MLTGAGGQTRLRVCDLAEQRHDAGWVYLQLQRRIELLARRQGRCALRLQGLLPKEGKVLN